MSFVGTVRPVKPDIDEVSRDLFRRHPAIQIIDAESGTHFCQPFVDLGVLPANVTEFEGKSILTRKGFQKIVKSLAIESPFRRQLKEDGAKLGVKRLHHFQELGKGFRRISEFFHVCDIPAGFDRENKAIRNCVSPMNERFFLRKAIKGVVDFYGLKMFFIVSKEVFWGDISWIESSSPVLVMPARCADMNVI